MIKILMMLAKLAVGLHKINAFWYKSYDVNISAQDTTKRILSRDQSLVTLALLWEKLSSP